MKKVKDEISMAIEKQTETMKTTMMDLYNREGNWIVSVRGGEITMHDFVLSARCPRLLDDEGIFKYVDIGVVMNIKRYLYMGEFSEEDYEILFKVLKAAKVLELRHLVCLMRQKIRKIFLDGE